MSEDVIQKYWDDLPREMRVELLMDSSNKVQMLNRATAELGLELEADGNKGGHLSNEEFAEFVIAVMEKYGGDA